MWKPFAAAWRSRPGLRALGLLLGLATGALLRPAPAIAQPSDVAALQRDLTRTIRSAGAPARTAVLVVSLDRGDTLFSLNPDLPLIPASNMKLFSTAAALYYLGPDYRYHTFLLADGEPRDGVLPGDLVLYGTGDPSIAARLQPEAAAAFRALADTLRARGIREIDGDLVGDGSYFDARWTGEGWTAYDRLAWYAPPVGALSFAENLVSVRVAPGARPGEAARIRTEPATMGLAVVNRVRTVRRGPTRVQVRHGDDALILEGQIRVGQAGATYRVPVVDPANYAAAAFREVLRERGVRVHGGVRSVHDPLSALAPFGPQPRLAPRPRVLAVHASTPLSELARFTNHISHNLFAEALLKTAGRVALGEGSFDAGARVILHFLEREVGVDVGPLRIIDGSGISPANRVTARTTVRLLAFMTGSDVAPAFETSLPVAGQTTGLKRMFGTRAAGNLRAKTGTLSDVSSLSGYVHSADGERLAFSIIANDVRARGRAKALEDAIGVRLASFRRAGAAAVLPEAVAAALP